MSRRHARILALLVYLAMLAATTWPGLLLVNRVEPKILGLPFHMAWMAAWIVIAFVTLLVVDRAETREEDRGPSGGP